MLIALAEEDTRRDNNRIEEENRWEEEKTYKLQIVCYVDDVLIAKTAITIYRRLIHHFNITAKQYISFQINLKNCNTQTTNRI